MRHWLSARRRDLLAIGMLSVVIVFCVSGAALAAVAAQRFVIGEGCDMLQPALNAQSAQRVRSAAAQP